MNNKAVSLLLSNADSKEVYSELEIKRLSDKFGQPFILNLYPIDVYKLDLIKDKDEKQYKALELSLKDLNNKELLEARGVSSFNELIDEIFIVGEVNDIYNAILDVSVISKEDVNSLKQDPSYEDAYWLWKNKYINIPSDYFKLSFADKQILTEFINRRETERKEEMQEILNQVGKAKDPFAIIGQILLRQTVEIV